MAVQSKPLAEVVGENCRRIRTRIGITQSQLAHYARVYGLRWIASSAADFEAGRSAPSLATVLALVLALQTAADDAVKRSARAPVISSVRLADLVGVDGFIELNFAVDVAGRELADVCSGDVPTIDPGRIRQKIAKDTSMERNSEGAALAEQRLARRLGVTRNRLTDVSFRLWQSTFSEERDRRAGANANQQKRGRVSRELRAELEKAISESMSKSEDDDGND